MKHGTSFVGYPPIERHGVIGDRRTAALVAADGTLDWMCLPNFDGGSTFSLLLDKSRGGYWRIGPEVPVLGHQRYVEDTAVLVTEWDLDGAQLELTDTMVWPEDKRREGLQDRRVVIRRLRCAGGDVACSFDLYPTDDFTPISSVHETAGGLTFTAAGRTFGLWTTFPVRIEGDSIRVSAQFRVDEEFWAVLSREEPPSAWSVDRARAALEDTATYWRDCLLRLELPETCPPRIKRSAMLVYLLTYAPQGSVVAAPTSSLPERIGGDRNYDYRYSWVRDASLSMATLGLLGDTPSAERYMGWLARRDSSTESPLQVVYRVGGGTELTQQERTDLEGYKGSLPVRFGNHAAGQRQLDSLGFLAECALVYLEQGGSWYEECWQTVKSAAGYTAANWHKPDHGIWELSEQRHYVSSKVMSWVVLDRALRIAQRTGRTHETHNWAAIREQIHAEVMELGWSERLEAFRQSYESDRLDAAGLLIAVTGLLPPDHPRVLSTIERIEEQLAKDGLVHRFAPDDCFLPLGEFEGAFLPCTFWLATAHARAGNVERAEQILERCESLAGDLGVFAEEVDVRSGSFLGNTPLLFSQVEYVRARLEVARAQPASSKTTSVT